MDGCEDYTLPMPAALPAPLGHDRACRLGKRRHHVALDLSPLPHGADPERNVNEVSQSFKSACDSSAPSTRLILVMNPSNTVGVKCEVGQSRSLKAPKLYPPKSHDSTAP